QLTLPGLVEIPLAGLDAEQAALRLRAEPLLQGMEVEITRLTLTATGRAALKPFGYEIFRQPQDPYYPSDRVQVPGDYVLGPGDHIQIAIFGRDFAQYSLTVNSHGELLVPSIGPIAVAG